MVVSTNATKGILMEKITKMDGSLVILEDVINWCCNEWEEKIKLEFFS